VTEVVPSKKQQGRGDAECLHHQFEPGGGSAQWQRGADLTYAVPVIFLSQERLMLWQGGADFADVRIAQNLEAQFFKLLRYRRLQITCGAKLVGYCGQTST